MPEGDEATDDAFMVKVLDQVQRNVAVELSVLAALTFAFLLVFPDRPTLANVGLALFALALLALNARYTKNVVWGQFPPALDRRSRVRKTCMFVGPVTGIVVIAFFATGLALGYLEGGWETAVRRVGNWRVLVALALYFPWALLQQTLFQFYLLGRLRTVFPGTVAVTCTGIVYALVHPPDVSVTVATAVAGVCWSYIYYRYRVLTPLALSHALLGATFYYWYMGKIWYRSGPLACERLDRSIRIFMSTYKYFTSAQGVDSVAKLILLRRCDFDREGRMIWNGKHAVRLRRDIHDTGQRMFFIFRLFRVSGQVDNFVLVFFEELAA